MSPYNHLSSRAASSKVDNKNNVIFEKYKISYIIAPCQLL